MNVGKALEKVDFFIREDNLATLIDIHDLQKVHSNRPSIETFREELHEEFFGKLYYKYCSNYGSKTHFVETTTKDGYGLYTGESFPPYLGRIVPNTTDYPLGKNVKWEIRAQFILPAIRWVLRGLVHSGHLIEFEPSSLENSDIDASVMTNHIYFKNKSMEPYEVLDVKEIQRKKRMENNVNEEDKDDVEEVELSAYEKMRAERVARNKERLKALGLA